MKGHNCYNCEYTITQECKFLREPENQHSEQSDSVGSKKINCTSENMFAC